MQICCIYIFLFFFFSVVTAGPKGVQGVSMAVMKASTYTKCIALLRCAPHVWLETHLRGDLLFGQSNRSCLVSMLTLSRHHDIACTTLPTRPACVPVVCSSCLGHAVIVFVLVFWDGTGRDGTGRDGTGWNHSTFGLQQPLANFRAAPAR